VRVFVTTLEITKRKCHDDYSPGVSFPDQRLSTIGSRYSLHGDDPLVLNDIHSHHLEFFAAQFDSCDLAAQDIECKTKDASRIAGKTLSAVCAFLNPPEPNRYGDPTRNVPSRDRQHSKRKCEAQRLLAGPVMRSALLGLIASREKPGGQTRIVRIRSTPP
jgi:hypothetical protein